MSLENGVTINGVCYPVAEAELHLPLVDDCRMMYLAANSEAGISLAVWGVELTCLDKIDDLDGKRLHVYANGVSCEDDTLGTDIIGASDGTGVQARDDSYSFGEISVDFRRVEGMNYRCIMQFRLTDSDEDDPELSMDDFNVSGSADFTVAVDEDNPV